MSASRPERPQPRSADQRDDKYDEAIGFEVDITEIDPDDEPPPPPPVVDAGDQG